MPRISNVFRRLFLLSLPSLNSYIAFSAFFFGVGLYYNYRIGKNPDNNNLNENFEKRDDGSFANEQNVLAVLFTNFTAHLRRHRFLFYVMINSCCALICLLGKSLVSLLFGALANQEESMLRKFFRRFVSAKLTFLVFISQHNLFEDISIWTPWLGIHALCLLLLELTNLRLANAHNVISNSSVRHRLFAATSIIGISSLLMLFLVVGIRNYINLSYCLFLAADCSLLLLQSLHLLFKLFMLTDTNAQRSQHSSLSAHYFDLAYEMVRDCLEFANYLHMIFYSQLAITYCCVFLVVQAQHYYRRISGKIRKYLQQQELMRHINNNYGIATEEDLLKNDQCTICWQPMKNARKLPCAHIFHEHCLRRWLEQDSSCAICRKTLALNLARPQQAVGGVEENGLQVLLEAFSPQNNRFARWWTRYIFEALNDEQTAGMVNQVSEMFPQIPIETIRNLINTTGSPTVAIEFLLGRNGQNENIVENGPPPNQQLGLNDATADSSSDGSSETSEAGSDSELDANQAAVGAQSQNHQMLPLVTSEQTRPRLPFTWKNNNNPLEQKMHELLLTNRRKYLESVRGAGFH